MNKKNDIERNIGICMRVGVITAAIVMLFGFVLLLLNFEPYFVGFDNFDINQILSGFLYLNPYSYMALGIFILILTPVIRVISSIVLFIKEENFLYSIITIAVLLILISSFLIAWFIG